MVRQRPDGRWEGRLTIGRAENGRYIYHYFSDRSLRTVTEMLHKKQAYYQGVNLCEKCRMPLGDWLDQWLEQYAAPAVRPGTLKNYRAYLDRYVKPQLGHLPIFKLTTQDIQELYADVQKNGRINKHPKYGHSLSPSTIHGLHGVLHQALDAAVQERLIARNPTVDVILPTMEEPEQTVLNDEQLDRFLEMIQRDAHWSDFFYTELTTGLRVGEICGLQWDDFDADKGTLTVRRTVHREEGGRLTVGDTKTDEGNRVITLPLSTLDLLLQRQKNALPVEWIFPDLLEPEKPMNPAKASRRFKEFLTEGGFPDMRFHDLRHTFATHALASGVDPKTLSTILGHTKPSFTLDRYTTTTTEMQQKAADIMGGFLSDIMV